MEEGDLTAETGPSARRQRARQAKPRPIAGRPSSGEYLSDYARFAAAIHDLADVEGLDAALDACRLKGHWLAAQLASLAVRDTRDPEVYMVRENLRKRLTFWPWFWRLCGKDETGIAARHEFLDNVHAYFYAPGVPTVHEGSEEKVDR